MSAFKTKFQVPPLSSSLDLSLPSRKKPRLLGWTSCWAPCVLEPHHVLWSFLYHQTPSSCRTLHIPPFPLPQTLTCTFPGGLSLPISSGESTSQWTHPHVPSPDSVPHHNLIAQTPPVQAHVEDTCSSPAAQTVAQNSPGSCPPVLKVRNLGGLDWLLSLLRVLGKTAANTTSEAESSPQMLQGSPSSSNVATECSHRETCWLLLSIPMWRKSPA